MKSEEKENSLLTSIVERASAPTPKFFLILRNAGLVIAALAGAIMSSPVVLPAVVVNAAGYLLVASGVLSAVSQVTVESDSL